MNESTILQGDSLNVLKTIQSDSVDAVITDPPYGYSFMGKDWDKAVPSVDIWRECLRVLKPGGWCMVMSAPRSDVQNAMISRLMEAGFRLDFTPIYWTYASGFPKAGNVGKLVDKRKGTTPDESREFAAHIKARRLELGITLSRADQEVCGGTTNYSWFEGRPRGQRLPKPDEYRRMKALLQLDGKYDEFIGEADREVVGQYQSDMGGLDGTRLGQKGGDITISATDQAKALDGSYTGFQPKPAVEVILVAMKPLSEKTYVDQALKNGKGITWLDDGRIPTTDTIPAVPQPKIHQEGKDTGHALGSAKGRNGQIYDPTQGRFPANLLVQDQALNTHSKFFDLDAWADTLPFLAVPKASKSEKNKGLEHFELRGGTAGELTARGNTNPVCQTCKGSKINRGNGTCNCEVPDWKAQNKPQGNVHPTVKPLKLMSYLITLTTREGDTVLDPFVGSGTTVVAAKQLGRNGIGIEREMEYATIAAARVAHAKQEKVVEQTSLLPDDIHAGAVEVPELPVDADAREFA